jgi:hypothetical protein
MILAQAPAKGGGLLKRTRFDSGCVACNCFISSGTFFQSTRVFSFLSLLILAGKFRAAK